MKPNWGIIHKETSLYNKCKLQVRKNTRVSETIKKNKRILVDWPNNEERKDKSIEERPMMINDGVNNSNHNKLNRGEKQAKLVREENSKLALIDEITFRTTARREQTQWNGR
jgi:hypothetical protein